MYPVYTQTLYIQFIYLICILSHHNSDPFSFLLQVESTTSLGDVVVVPKMYPQYCTESVLVSEWIEGTKLSSIDVKAVEGRETVRKLTQVLLNCYLVQLLETGIY